MSKFLGPHYFCFDWPARVQASYPVWPQVLLEFPDLKGYSLKSDHTKNACYGYSVEYPIGLDKRGYQANSFLMS